MVASRRWLEVRTSDKRKLRKKSAKAWSTGSKAISTILLPDQARPYSHTPPRYNVRTLRCEARACWKPFQDVTIYNLRSAYEVTSSKVSLNLAMSTISWTSWTAHNCLQSPLNSMLVECAHTTQPQPTTHQGVFWHIVADGCNWWWNVTSLPTSDSFQSGNFKTCRSK